MYSKYRRERTLQLYDRYKSVSKVTQQLEYPTRKNCMAGLLNGIPRLKIKLLGKDIIILRIILKLKLETIHRYFELGKCVQLVPEEIGYSRVSIYIWRKSTLLKEPSYL